MRKTLRKLLILGFIFGNMSLAWALPAIDRTFSTGGGYSVTCQGFGVEMCGSSVKSCLLAILVDLPVTTQKLIPCAAKYATAFRGDGRVEYCTLGADTSFQRTTKEALTCKAGGRVVVRTDGTVQSATLKDSVELPYKKGATVACRGDSPVAFRTGGDVETCILDRETVFVATEKKNLEKTCLVGGLIAFDEDGKFSGCYPPAPRKSSLSQGGRTP